ncbi:MAG: ribonuclease P protein component [Planctomycetaceae bacterium]|nr:ribonuclease P protein component [Planctomycetaceae bacterium]
MKFPPWRRLRSKFDFAAIYDHRQKAGDRWMLVFARRNGLGYTRIGLSVSRKHGNSVVRHRLRRLLKEAYRLEQHSIPEGLDMILIPGHQALGATLSDFRDSLVRLSRKLTNRLPHRQL